MQVLRSSVCGSGSSTACVNTTSSLLLLAHIPAWHMACLTKRIQHRLGSAPMIPHTARCWFSACSLGPAPGLRALGYPVILDFAHRNATLLCAPGVSVGSMYDMTHTAASPCMLLPCVSTCATFSCLLQQEAGKHLLGICLYLCILHLLCILHPLGMCLHLCILGASLVCN